MLSKHQQELLCDGYIRINFNNTAPTEINRMIQKFWNEYFWWTFTEGKLTDFLNANPGDYIEGETINICDILCIPVIYPNDAECIEQVKYGLDFYLLPDVKSTVVYYELYCPQTQIFYKDSTTLLNDDNNLLLWSEHMKLSQCHNETQLDFMCYVDILRIEYDPNCGKQNYYKDIKISNKSECKWDISTEQLELWKHYTCSDVRSDCVSGPSFDNNCWLLSCFPVGDEHSDTVTPNLTLLQVPYNVAEMKFKLTLNIEPDILQYETIYSFDVDDETWDLGINTGFTLGDIIGKSNNSAISIHWKIEIIDE
eukprot:406920_1